MISPSLYFHLYGENKITLPIDEPLPEFGGLTAFQVSQNAFRHHKSQHWTWFYGWLYGKNEKITKATQIKTYNPCYFGLYHSIVGPDVEKNDLFENIATFLQQEEEKRLEQERLEQERLEKERQEAEKAARADQREDGGSPEDGQAALESVLAEMRGGTVRIAVPRNDEERRLLDMARSNARESAKNRKDTASLADRLASAFRWDRPVVRVECADVSHTGGESTKVGAVVYEDGRPLKEDYRVWNIEGAGGDDYAALTMWAKRRLEHGEPWPDLLLIDGGRGQLAAVDKILREELAHDTI